MVKLKCSCGSSALCNNMANGETPARITARNNTRSPKIRGASNEMFQCSILFRLQSDCWPAKCLLPVLRRHAHHIYVPPGRFVDFIESEPSHLRGRVPPVVIRHVHRAKSALSQQLVRYRDKVIGNLDHVEVDLAPYASGLQNIGCRRILFRCLQRKQNDRRNVTVVQEWTRCNFRC